MKAAQFNRQADESVLVRLMTPEGPCDLFAIHADRTVELRVTCPRVDIVELIGLLIRASEVQLIGKANS